MEPATAGAGAERPFRARFPQGARLQDIAAVADQFKPSPLVGVFEGGYEEYRRQAQPGRLRNPISIQRGMQIGSLGRNHAPGAQLALARDYRLPSRLS